MQRDVKIGIAIGVLLIALIAIFMWQRSESRSYLPSTRYTDDQTSLSPAQEPVTPIGIEPETALTEGPEIVAPEGVGTAVGDATGPGTPEPSESAAAELAAPRTHIVKKGETLSSIAAQYYGSSARPKRDLIYNANRSLMGDNRDHLEIGWKLVIPSEE